MKCTIGKKRHWYPTAVFLRFGPVGLNISSEKHEPLLTGVYPFVPAQRQNYFSAFSSHQNHIPLKDASGQQRDETDKCLCSGSVCWKHLLADLLLHSSTPSSSSAQRGAWEPQIPGPEAAWNSQQPVVCLLPV